MKRLFFIICLIFFVFEYLSAYQSILVEGYSWNVIYSGGDLDDDNLKLYTKIEKIEGDSIIDGITYKKLWEIYDTTNVDRKNLLALLREDTSEQKVFAYQEGVEVLLYDLGVEVGDTIKVWDCLRQLNSVNLNNIEYLQDNFTAWLVDEIDTIEDEVYGLLKKITYYVKEVNTKIVIYERYGSISGWASSNYRVPIGGSSGFMICAFDEKGEVVFKRKYTIKGYGEVKECYINAEINRNKVDTPKKKENVYYNSQDRTLRVDFEKNERIDIYNTMGKRVMRKKVEEGCKSISCNLNAGIYIVTAKNSNTHTKIVVK